MAFAVILTLPATAKSENTKTSYPDNHAQDVVVLFVKKPVIQFPDRTEQYKQAVAQDNARAEQARLEAARQAELARVVNTPVPTQNTPQTAVSGSDAEYKAFIYNHESGNNPLARNAGGCLGLGQACPGSKLLAVCPNLDYACEDAFFTNYAIGRYGSWAGAYSFWLSHRWW